MASAGHRRHFADPHVLLKTQYNSTATHWCDICQTKLAGLVGYRCNACNFDVHEACADYFEESISFFAHPWHTLTLTRMPKSCDGWACDLCRKKCPAGSFVYRCVPCMFDVHPLCTMLPQTLRSPLHPAHDLNMVPSWGNCSACHGGLPGWQYICGRPTCLFRLHIECASGSDDAAAVTTQTQATGSAAQGNTVARRSSGNSIAKFLLKRTFLLAIDAATGGLASPIFEVLDAAWN